MQKPSKLLLTGGHAATTAYAVMQEIKRQKLDWKLYWIGAKTTIERAKVKNFEEELFRDYEVDNYHITAGKLQKKTNLSSVVSFLKIPFGFISAFILVAKIKPDAVLSFGGYVSFPVILAARIFGKPVVVHEQTSVAGLANIKASRFASVIALSRESSAKYFPDEKCVITGNPVSREIASINPKNKLSKTPLILVTGGSRGSQIINKTVFEATDEMIKKYKIIHLTGSLDYKKAADLEKNNKSNRYKVFDNVAPEKMAELFDQADIVVSRAGANTVSEIITASRPALLIPIPWTRYDEQNKNAEYAKEAGIAEVLKEKSLSKRTLLNSIAHISQNWKKMAKSTSEVLNNDENAAENLIQVIKNII